MSHSQTATPGVLLTDFFQTIYRYREYLKQSVARDLRKRYKRTVLGYVWSMLNPLLMMTILAVVFSKIMNRSTDDYAVFLFSGLLPWRYFQATVSTCLGSISSNVKLMNQVPVPKYLFPLAHSFSNLTDFFLTIVPLFVVMLVLGRDFPVTILALPIVLLPLFFFSVGMGMLFAVSNVFFQDTKHLTGVILQALYFLCPILYSRDQLPEYLFPYITLNPMFGIIEMMRGLFYDGQLPELLSYSYIFFGSFFFLLFSLWLFRKADDKFIYFI